MTDVAKCCAHGCSSTLINSPLNKFYKLTEVRASLTEWLLALNRQEILRQFTNHKKPVSLSICDKHFPSLRTPKSPSSSDVTDTATQTKIPPTLMLTPVEIVDIQPEPPLTTTLPINIPTIIPGQPNVVSLSRFFGNNNNPELQYVNNNVPGFIGIAPVQTIVEPPPVTSQNSVPTLPRILPRFGPNAPYVVNLTGSQSTPMLNIIDVPGVMTATNFVQSLNVNSPVTNPSVPTPRETDNYDIVDLREEDPIKIEDEKTQDSDCDSDIVKLEFPGRDENGQDVKFEIGTSDDNVETYCFFEDDEVGNKRRRVRSADNSFQIVKLELDADRPIT